MIQDFKKKTLIFLLLTTNVLSEDPISDNLIKHQNQTDASCTKIEGALADFVRNLDANQLLESQNDIKDKVLNMEACLGQKVEKVFDMISAMAKKEHVCPSNMICVERGVQRKTGRFLGCYEDCRLQRILKGYATRLNYNTKESCVDICLEKRFVYAGTEAG